MNIGHNNPPTLADELKEKTVDLATRTNALVEAAGRAPEAVCDAETAEKVTTLIAQLKAVKKAAEDMRKQDKEPHLEAGRVVDRHYKAFSDIIDPIGKKLQGSLTAYQVELERRQREAELAEKRRIAEEQRQREEQARQAAEAGDVMRQAQINAEAEQAAKEAVKAPEKVKTKTDYGSTASLRTVTRVRVTDSAKLPQAWLLKWLDPDAIQKAANLALRNGDAENVPGIEVFQEKTSTVRG